MVQCGDRAINGIALTFHELATNAAKCGALSAPNGSVSVNWEKDGQDLIVKWVERGGPAVSSPQVTGFGGSLVRNTVVRQFGGSLEYEWQTSGLVVTVNLSIERIST
jgi:two-component sensor histidine kinase